MATNPERTDIGMRIGIGDCEPAQHFEGKKGHDRGTTGLERTDIRMSMSIGDSKPATLLEAG